MAVFSSVLKCKIHNKYIAITKLGIPNNILYSNSGWQLDISKRFLSHVFQLMTDQVDEKEVTL